MLLADPPVALEVDYIDIGHGVSIAYRKLRDVQGQGAVAGIAYQHPKPDGTPCGPSWVPFKGRYAGSVGGWEIVRESPLTLAPSLLCRSCRHHGFIRDGKWVPA
jgi:hypothetical protein